MIDAMRDALLGYGNTGIVVWIVLKILAIAVPVIIAVAMFVYWERKVIGWMHVRMGPNQIGPFGLLQAFADVFKLLFKEVILPANVEQGAVLPGADDRPGSGLRRLVGDSVRRRAWYWPTSMSACCCCWR